MTAFLVLYTVLTLLLVPVFALLLLITAAALVCPASTRRAGGPAAGTAPRFLFAIPAHDEEVTIRRTVESCRAVAYDPDRFSVYVVADNCSDATADIARRAGAEVMERTDPIRRSKGHALEYFFEHGPLKRFDAAIVVDADSTVDPGILTAFAEELIAGHDWLQCYDTVRNQDASWRTRLMTYAFSLINGVWLVGQERLRLGVALRGNGMCFSTRGLARVPWRAHGLAEDLEFSWALRLAGERAHYVPRSRVLAEMLAQGGAAAASQRCRWEAGRRALHAAILGPLLRSRKIGWYRKVMYLIELFFPPFVGLLLALLAAASVHLGPMIDTRMLPLSRVLLPVHAAMAAVLAGYALSPVLVMHLPARYLISLLALPYYVVWKTTAMLRRRPSAWVRTRREPSLPEGSTP